MLFYTSQPTGQGIWFYKTFFFQLIFCRHFLIVFYKLNTSSKGGTLSLQQHKSANFKCLRSDIACPQVSACKTYLLIVATCWIILSWIWTRHWFFIIATYFIKKFVCLLVLSKKIISKVQSKYPDNLES